MTPSARAKITVTIALVLLVLVAAQIVLLASGWSSDDGDVFSLVLLVVQFVLASVVLVAGLRARKRITSRAAPPVDNPPEN